MQSDVSKKMLSIRTEEKERDKEREIEEERRKKDKPRIIAGWSKRRKRKDELFHRTNNAFMFVLKMG